MKVDVQQEYLEQICAILSIYLPTQAKVYVFGSRATGKAKKYSDLDLLIDTGEPLPLATLAALAESFDESALPYKVDLVDAWAITDSFKSNIQSQCIELTHRESKRPLKPRGE